MLASFHTACIMNILLTHFFYTPNSKMAAYPVKLGPVASKQGIEGHLLVFSSTYRFRKCFKTAVYQNVEKKGYVENGHKSSYLKFPEEKNV